MPRVALILFGAGFAFTSGLACEGSLESDVEVVEQGSFAVLLSESNGVPVDALSEQRILAGQQHVLISHRDPEGRKEPTKSFVQLDLSPGHQQLELGGDEDEEPIVVAFEAVSKEEIVGIELLQANEEELSPGTWVEVDVVGVTKGGEQVRSIHPRFEAGGDTHLGYFTYRFDPEADPQKLEVQALGWLQRTRFRGLAMNKAKPASVLKR